MYLPDFTGKSVRSALSAALGCWRLVNEIPGAEKSRPEIVAFIKRVVKELVTECKQQIKTYACGMHGTGAVCALVNSTRNVVGKRTKSYGYPRKNITSTGVDFTL
jgi:hypothetical protein